MRSEQFDDELEANLEAFLTQLNKGSLLTLTFLLTSEFFSIGSIKPYLKSAPVPREDKGPVKTLVASNFATIVNDESKDVLIEFFAPWCGHCKVCLTIKQKTSDEEYVFKAFEPKYKQFAAKHASEQPNLVIAKFDATSNDIPEKYSVEGFPTLYFAPSGKKSTPVKYTGNRELYDLENFLKKNAVKSFQTKEEL